VTAILRNLQVGGGTTWTEGTPSRKAMVLVEARMALEFVTVQAVLRTERT
jgi:hypothetical protein